MHNKWPILKYFFQQRKGRISAATQNSLAQLCDTTRRQSVRGKRPIGAASQGLSFQGVPFWGSQPWQRWTGRETIWKLTRKNFKDDTERRRQSNCIPRHGKSSVVSRESVNPDWSRFSLSQSRLHQAAGLLNCLITCTSGSIPRLSFLKAEG